MTLQEASELKINNTIDHRDIVGAIIKEKNGSILKIHHLGWSEKWDTWSDYKKELYEFAKYKSISTRPRRRFFNLEKDEFVALILL